MMIKPRHPSGILVAVHGDRDFMVLQMVNGTIKFTVDNGKGPLSSSFSKEPYDLCDGNWHSIRGISQSQSVPPTHFNLTQFIWSGNVPQNNNILNKIDKICSVQV